MRRLFSKIFLSFWLSHILAVALSFAVFTAAQSQRDEDERRGPPPNLPSSLLLRHARVAAPTYAQSRTRGEARARVALATYLKEVRKESGLRALLFDGKQRELSGGEALFSQDRESRAGSIRALVQRSLLSGEAEFFSSREGLVGARRVRVGRESYVLVAQMPRVRSGTRGASFGVRRQQTFEAARLFGILVAAGLVSWGLARYLAAPIVTLRRATQQLAAGDLSARVGPQMGRRRDELADLSHDFDLMAERMEGLLQAQSRLLGDISHELRSPLARLKVALELVQSDLSSPEADASTRKQTRDFLHRIEREAGRMDALIGQLLSLTRLESGDAKASFTSLDLSRLVEEVASDADFEAQNRRCQVRVDSSDPCFVQGAPELLRSAVENVVRNAVRYTQEGTTVEVAVQCAAKNERGEAVVKVRDRGPGVPEETLGQLFRPFYRVATARDRSSGGVGLGLAIAERAVRSHGGSMSASNAPEGGLIVEIRLPLTSSTAPAQSKIA